ncbi:MAG: hypothetical protein ACI4B5_03270 [Bacteroidaceae bacterium]
MNKYLCAVFLAVVCTPVSAQRGKVSAEDLDAPIMEAISLYDFTKAEELLQQKIGLLEKKKKSTEYEDSLLEIVQKGSVKLYATERVIFIDSLVLPKSALLENISLGAEGGTLVSYEQYFSRKDTLGCSVFENQLKNKIIFSAPIKGGILKLFESVRNGDEWSNPSLLLGLDDNEEDNMNWPFMLSDGQTLYFSASNEESMGGYDIYMTRYDVDEHKYLSPENLGMPFNSPANDYLFVIDEFNNLGWFATDRNQPADSVCLYTFIPNDTRRTYEDGSVSNEQLRSFARIGSIRDTWTDKKRVQEAYQRLLSLKEESTTTEQKGDFYFVVNDRHICQTLADFRNEKAREKMAWLLESRNECEKTAAELQKLRDQYANASRSSKVTLAPQIRILEAKLEQQKADLRVQEKQIRRMELNN